MLSHEVAISQQSAECRNCAISSAATIRPLAVVRSERYLVPMTDSINNIDASSLPEPDRVEIERLRAAYDLSRPAREHRGNSPVVNIHVSADRSNRGDAAQRVYNFGTSDVAAMNDVIDASQATLRLRPEQPVGVGDDPDPEGHREVISCADEPVRHGDARPEPPPTKADHPANRNDHCLSSTKTTRVPLGHLFRDTLGIPVREPNTAVGLDFRQYRSRRWFPQRDLRVIRPTALPS